MANPIVFIHGYSDQGESFQPWQKELESRGYDVKQVRIGNYVSLTNEVTIKDIAEGFNRALQLQADLANDEPFDAIVHSTGMLVIRSWLANYPTRVNRLKHLIAIAPATFGSPLAHKGRSWIGAIFKGNKNLGPDFMEAGDHILEGLELGSQFTWDLAHIDLLGENTFYGPTKKTPYVFIFCGNKQYGGLRRLVSEDGTDGTVRWAGCALNTRKIILDLTRNLDDSDRIRLAPWTNVDIPLVPVANLNHGTIVSAPTKELVDLVDKALQVTSANEFSAWQQTAGKKSEPIQKAMTQYQQFVVHAVDERGDPIKDFNIQLFTRNSKSNAKEIEDFDLAVHTFAADPSYRCFHVNLSKLKPDTLVANGRTLWLRVRATTGSALVGYHGYGDKNEPQEINLELTPWIANREIKLFYPFTTTLIELRLNREPLPMDGKNDVFWFLPGQTT